MKPPSLPLRAIVLATMLTLPPTLLAQAPALTAPNNSAGTPNEPPEGKKPDVKQETIIPKAALPERTDTARGAFVKLDPEKRGYVTLSDILQLRPQANFNFDDADRDRDGRLSYEEFAAMWEQYRTARP